MRGKFLQFVLGVLTGAALFGGATAVAAGIIAEPSWSPIFVDGRQVQMTAYNIGGNNYVKLRDIGQAVGFNVYYQDGVQVDSDAPYTGAAPAGKAPAQQDSGDTGGSMDLTANMDIRQEMIRLINQTRRENGVAELTINEALMNAAQHCSAQKFTSHNTKYECETAMSYGYPHGFGDNLTCFSSAKNDIAQTAVNNWINSPGHFQAMIDPKCDTIGVGVTIVSGRAYCYMFAGDPHIHHPYE